ncbi:spore wall maturation protein DIT1-like protein 2 [Rhypophila decipiens]|uniref:Spore wall maturation protein DIT1-like protein 2 n=1 Tax=Rhypophila decipiens TaxID=261697 RepID=A0AAN7B063_9PEZI|nr:spore wall maturation protein DIT1-like protein 2 [Rhypophila decipiens]
MSPSNDEMSAYDRLAAMVLSDASGTLLHATGPQDEWISAHWKSFLPDGPTTSLSIYSGQRLPDGNIVSLILKTSGEGKNNDNLDAFFAQLILNQTTFATHPPTVLTAAEAEESASSAAAITAIFDSYLRYQGKDDKWTAVGSSYFLVRVKRFTAKKARIELCLPAFPCKSSNPNKVTGKSPDRGEWLALERLHGFVEAVGKVYPPGALVWIISDGHVFSDCIGVDDADVDRYGEQLAEMNRTIGLASGRADSVQFRSLVDLFCHPSNGEDMDRLGLAALEHVLPTSMTDEAELCRRILMAGFQPQRTKVRAHIESGDSAVLALYRGFSRFMLEDLELHPFTQKMSRSKQKKLSSEVAFEMILRNQAYSNLVELLFPHHLRLSIHAHNNAGPKFGIQLFDPASVRVAKTLDPDSATMTTMDLLHIPTPWHNCVVRLGDRVVVTKSKTARDAVASGTLAGGLVQGGSRSGEYGGGGACFELHDPMILVAACQNACDAAAARGEAKMPTVVEVVETTETTVICHQVDGSNSEGGSSGGQFAKVGSSTWLSWLQRLTSWWVWSRSSAHAMSGNPYHPQHKSQGLGA